ncbi:DUF2812 domain-containing protein [Clostridium paraputrificum]|uniref:DUF2812 domain-containing protein n=1 Tax=Clostridium TaxID=1485 RepID=UPI003D354223
MMEISKWRYFVNCENEEKWLNEMSAKGYIFTNFDHCQYTFKRGELGKYIYRIQFLDGNETEEEYAEVLKDSGIDIVSRVGKWVYLRRDSKEGEFEIFTDIDSKVANYQKMTSFTTRLAYGAFITLLLSIFIAIKCANINSFFSGFGTGMAFVLLPMNLFLDSAAFKYRNHMNELIKEKTLYE